MTESSVWLPKGEQGDPGPVGPPGPQGPTGPVGGPGPDAAAFVQYTEDIANQVDTNKGGSLVGWKRGPYLPNPGTVSQFLNTTSINVWEKRFTDLIVTKPTPSDPETWDWLPAFQAAIDELAAGHGGTVDISPMKYQLSGKLELKSHVNLQGKGFSYIISKGTVLQFNGTDDGMVMETASHCTVSDISFYGPNLVAGKAVVAASNCAHVVFTRCSFLFNGVGNGLILDMTMITRTLYCYYEAVSSGNGACLWLVNGSDRRPENLKQYTNEITVFGCHLNAVNAFNTCIKDDGGLSHKFIYSNFNGGVAQIIAKEVGGLSIIGNEMEAASVVLIRFHRPLGDTAVYSATISDNLMLILPGASGTVVDAGVMDSLTYCNNVMSGVNSDNGLPVPRLMAHGNVNISGGTPPTNNYGTSGTKQAVLAGGTVPGSHTYIARTAQWYREGNSIRVVLNLTISTKDAAMTGAVEIDCLPTAVTGDYQSGSLAAYGGVSMPSGNTQLSFLAIPGTTKIRFYTGGSGVTGRVLDASGIVSGFSISLTFTYI